MQALFNQTASIVSRTAAAADRYNNPTYTSVVRGPFPCRLEQTSTTEMENDRETVVTVYRLFLLPAAALQADEEVTINGKTYRVDGDPAYREGRSSVHHIEARLKEVRT